MRPSSIATLTPGRSDADVPSASAASRRTTRKLTNDLDDRGVARRMGQGLIRCHERHGKRFSKRNVCPVEGRDVRAQIPYAGHEAPVRVSPYPEVRVVFERLFRPPRRDHAPQHKSAQSVRDLDIDEVGRVERLARRLDARGDPLERAGAEQIVDRGGRVKNDQDAPRARRIV